VTIPRVELLAPARDLSAGLAAIDAGADAVYIGATRFGARASAGNPLDDIAALVQHAHLFWARVYVTINTLLRDDELEAARQLAWELHDIGVDGLIIQDVGLLECELPPLPLIASTQMHNHTLERVAFLEQVGFQRVILARELSLEQIRHIREHTRIELEFFVHGALCVCYSGQCAMSYAIGGRSGNRGECAQPCRRRYSLFDGGGNTLVRDRYLLSLRDLNLTPLLDDLLDAGITAFKIEGRLKDRAYVMNVVGHYRRELDRRLAVRGWHRSSSGASQFDFEPNVAKTFNRGYTTYFVRGRSESPGAVDTPKMVGEMVGRVVAVDRTSFELDGDSVVHPGDGLCFFDDSNELCGTPVNAVHGRRVVPNRMDGIRVGRVIYRNHDHEFLTRLAKSRVRRHIAVCFTLAETPEGFRLVATDEDGNRATASVGADRMSADRPEMAIENVRRQLTRTGGTPFVVTDVRVQWAAPRFLPLAVLNRLRRAALEQLADVRAANRPVAAVSLVPNAAPFPEQHLDYLGNVLNRKAAAFYRRHGVLSIEPAAESGLDLHGRRVMRTQYCLRHQLGWCPPGPDEPRWREPLCLVDAEGRRFELRFDCRRCEMEIIFVG
jgi:collagenase-like PrtC family protease